MHISVESYREEVFYDLQLNVKGFSTLRDSFKEFCAEEVLDGDNKYMAEGHGLQAAKKGIVFTHLPPVLHIQLKRFEYDFMREMMVKINDRFEFPEDLDLGEFLERPEDTPARYTLYAVLVHMGDVFGGHYIAYIRTTKDGEWFRFDDDRVTRSLRREAIEENYGQDDGTGKAQRSPPGYRATSRFGRRFTSAYMLVYMRNSHLYEVMAPITDADVPKVRCVEWSSAPGARAWAAGESSYAGTSAVRCATRQRAGPYVLRIVALTRHALTTTGACEAPGR